MTCIKKFYATIRETIKRLFIKSILTSSLVKIQLLGYSPVSSLSSNRRPHFASSGLRKTSQSLDVRIRSFSTGEMPAENIYEFLQRNKLIKNKQSNTDKLKQIKVKLTD